MKNLHSVKADDCVTVHGEGATEPLMFNGSLCLPAGDVYLVGAGGSTDEAITGGVLILVRGSLGMFQNMTPVAMRSMAEGLTHMADLADANSARMAAAAIAAAGKPRS